MNIKANTQFQGYFMTGLIIVLALISIVIFSYLFVAAAIIGLVLYVVSWIRRTFFAHRGSKNKPITYEHGEY